MPHLYCGSWIMPSWRKSSTGYAGSVLFRSSELFLLLIDHCNEFRLTTSCAAANVDSLKTSKHAKRMRAMFSVSLSWLYQLEDMLILNFGKQRPGARYHRTFVTYIATGRGVIVGYIHAHTST